MTVIPNIKEAEMGGQWFKQGLSEGKHFENPISKQQ
jgi:hypothetical protein